MTRKKIILPFFAAIVALSANAQTDSTKTFVLSGSVDAYTRTDFNNIGQSSFNNKTSFTQSNNSFELGMATLRGDGQILSGKVFGTADLGFGPRAEAFNGGNGAPGEPTLLAVKQLYLGLYTGKGATGIKFTIGKWATHIGYELVDAYANRNYSMDYMFTEGPFSHTGIKAEYTKSTWHFMIGVANPTNIVSMPDPTIVAGSATKHLLAQVDDGSKNGKYHVYLNYEGSFGMGVAGSGTVKAQNQIDIVATALLSSKFNIGLNLTDKMNSYNSAGGTTQKSDAWGGAALYLNWDPAALWGLTLRSEYFIDNDDLTGLGTQNILDETLSANFRVGPLTIIPEVRYESADTKFGDIYVKSDKLTPTGTDFSGILAAVYKF